MKYMLIKTIKKIFNICGLEVYKKGIRRTNLAEVALFLSKFNFKPQTVIDVGVADGTFELYDNFPNATHLLIEPLKEFVDDLEAITRNYKAQYILAAAGAKHGKIIMNVHPILTGSSIFNETEGTYADGIPREVPVITIDNACRERHLNGPYLIKVDVQGAELVVLEGAQNVLSNTEVVILEVQLFEFLVGSPQFYDVVSHMREYGFVVYDIFGNYYRPLDGALAAVDVVFVRENRQFRKDHSFATSEQH
ncbi:MAG: hypothetical protein B6242_08820 [Anaerolineaceae bacterium 4572_78]|nr:MAG: hypothetical protein B6242_08820 [Anaerolineaceae bacterium 4572_78]